MNEPIQIQQPAVFENDQLVQPALATVTEPGEVFAQPHGAALVRRRDDGCVEIVPGPVSREMWLAVRLTGEALPSATMPVPIERRYLFGEHVVRDADGQRVATVTLERVARGVQLTTRVWCENIVRREPAFMGTVIEFYFSEPGQADVKQIIIRAGEHGAIVPGGFTVEYVEPRPAGPFLFEALVSRPGETTGTMFGSAAAYRDNSRFGLFVPEASASVEIATMFDGFAAEWDPGFWLQDYSEDDWRLVVRRVERLGLRWVRMMVQAKWWRHDNGAADWESREMRSLYRHLDVCQERGIAVALTEWAPEDFTPAGLASPRYAAGVAEVAEHLIRRRGYSCIRRLIVMNEPSNLAGDAFAAWRVALENADAELRRRGLREAIAFFGPDSVEYSDWPRRAAREVGALLDAYGVHRYGTVEEVRAGELEAKLAGIRALISATDPHGFIKPLYLMEAGLWGDIQRGVNPAIATYEYGLDMADYAVQAARAGVAGVSAWMLADSNLCPTWMVNPGETPPEFNWGMWDRRGLRPWFYVWSLLTRLFPPGSEIYRPAQPDGVRLLRARRPDGGWSCCCVNRRTESFAIAERGNSYLYSRAGRATDADGFPQALPDTLTDCPPEAVLWTTRSAG